ncbi:hypothetical protein D3C81_1436690 [compost metagenome]
MARAGQLFGRGGGRLRQRVRVGDEQPHFRLFRQPRKPDVRRVTGLNLHHAEMRTAALQQVKHVAVFGDHPLQFDILIALLEKLHQSIMVFRLIGIGEHQAEARLDIVRQPNAQCVQPFAGGKDLLHVAQHLMAGGGQHRLACLAIEQEQPEIGLQVGDRRTDG